MSKYISDKYRGGLQYVWCGEHFNPAMLNKLSPASMVAPSSSPIGLYKKLDEEIKLNERHSATINAHRTKFAKLAIQWKDAREITEEQSKEITYIVKKFAMSYWRPLLYIIPRNIIDASRIEIVEPARRASLADEFIIKDLNLDEYDVLEF